MEKENKVSTLHINDIVNILINAKPDCDDEVRYISKFNRRDLAEQIYNAIKGNYEKL